jgi:hypothetical protein
MTARNFGPLHEVTMYQARCTNCGTIIDDYDDYVAFTEPETVIEWAQDYYFWKLTRVFRYKFSGDELLCTECQKREVCQSKPARYDGDHSVCAAHEDHDFDAPAMTL